MPVIRGTSHRSDLTPQHRKELLDRLAKELSGPGTPGGPVIFEIPLEQSDKIDVLFSGSDYLLIRAHNEVYEIKREVIHAVRSCD